MWIVGEGVGVCVPFFFAVSWGAMPQKKWLESARIRAVVSADYECGTMGLILCKVSGGERRYERTMDESNYARKTGRRTS